MQYCAEHKINKDGTLTDEDVDKYFIRSTKRLELDSMFQETSLLIWNLLLLMMCALEITRRCFTRSFCSTEKKMPPTTLPGVTTLLEKRSWIRLTIAYESSLTIRRMSKGLSFTTLLEKRSRIRLTIAYESSLTIRRMS